MDEQDQREMRHLDVQVVDHAAFIARALQLAEDDPWLRRPCSALAEEIRDLPDMALKEVRRASRVRPTDRIEELHAFNLFHTFVHERENHWPPLVRAQVQTELYFSFVYLKDSLLRPVEQRLPDDSTSKRALLALGHDPVRAMRNAVAHGNWTYLPDFSGLRFYDRPRQDGTDCWDILQRELNAWQALARGAAYAILEAVRERVK